MYYVVRVENCYGETYYLMAETREDADAAARREMERDSVMSVIVLTKGIKRARLGKVA